MYAINGRLKDGPAFILRSLALLIILVLIPFEDPTIFGAAAENPEFSASNQTLLPEVAELPIAFVPTTPRTHSDSRFMSSSPFGTLYFSEHDLQIVVPLPSQEQAMQESHIGSEVNGLTMRHSLAAAVTVRFANADENPKILGRERLPGRVNYLIGNDPAKWFLDVPSYSSIVYKSLFDGVDLHYEWTNGDLKATYVVEAGADPSQIRWRYDGPVDVVLDDFGALLIASTGEHLQLGENPIAIEEPPVAWQTVDDTRIYVGAAYEVGDDGMVSFVFDEYDHTRPLIIDPTLEFNFCTYVGGSSGDSGNGISIDGNGHIYVAGLTVTENGDQDAFVTKLDRTGSAVIYTAYLGGDEQDYATSIAVDAAGNAFVTGFTRSPNFPTVNAYQSGMANWNDAFVAKLSPNGNSLVFSTYFGGNNQNNELGSDIAVDRFGNAVVTGYTNAKDFPTVNALQSYPPGGWSDAFVAKFDPNGGVIYSTYLGGSGEDEGIGIDIDGEGSVYVTGMTGSPNFPTTPGVLQPSHGRFRDVFMTKLSEDGTQLIYSTFLGRAASNEEGLDISVDDVGNAFVTGYTKAAWGTSGVPEWDFPTTDGAFLTTEQARNGYLGSPLNFVLKINEDASELIYSTLFGNKRGHNRSNSITVDDSGHAYVTGWSGGWKAYFPLVDPIQIGCNASDAFVTKFNPDGTGLLFSTFLCGDHVDSGNGIALDANGRIVVVGTTQSPNFPAKNALRDILLGTSDAFVTRIGPPGNPPIADAGGPYSGAEGSAIALSDASASDADGDSLTYAWSVNSSLCSFSDPNILNPSLTCDENGSYRVTLEVSDGVNGTVSSEATASVGNVAPEVGAITVDQSLIAVDAAINARADFTDPGRADTHSAVWYWGDGSQCDAAVDTDCALVEADGSGSAIGSHTYTEPGVYTVRLRVTDDDGGWGESVYQFVVVYDPGGGFVTGGGWITSPEGACPGCDTSPEGKATFGFVSKYKKGATVPTGNTEFQFKAGNLNFHSSSYQWLVVAGSDYARFKGGGSINGELAPNGEEYKFMLWAGDKEPDTLRIRIWWEDADGNETEIYDNGMDQPIGGGNIVVHTK